MSEYKGRLISIGDKKEDSLVLVKYGSNELISDKSICLIKGKAKSGKSRLTMNLLKGFYNNDCDLGFKYTVCPKDKYILYVSTEMSNNELIDRKSSIIGCTHENYDEYLYFYDISEVTPRIDRLDDVIKLCESIDKQIHCLVIDQIADFIDTINDEESVNKVVDRISLLVKKLNCGAIFIMHQNEGMGKKARGHFGSVWEQKVIASISVDKKKNGHYVQCSQIRRGPGFKINCEFNTDTDMLKAVSDSNADQDDITYVYKQLNNSYESTKELFDHLSNITGKTSRSTHTQLKKQLISKDMLKSEAGEDKRITRYIKLSKVDTDFNFLKV